MFTLENVKKIHSESGRVRPRVLFRFGIGRAVFWQLFAGHPFMFIASVFRFSCQNAWYVLVLLPSLCWTVDRSVGRSAAHYLCSSVPTCQGKRMKVTRDISRQRRRNCPSSASRAAALGSANERPPCPSARLKSAAKLQTEWSRKNA